MSIEYDIRLIAREIVQEQVDGLRNENKSVMVERLFEHGLPESLTSEQCDAAVELYGEVLRDLKIRTY